MKLTKISRLTGLTHTLELPITEEDYNNWLNSFKLIQDAFPHLTPGQREFIISGCTAEEWEEVFGEED